MSLVEKDAKHVWHPFTQALTSPKPLPIVSAKDSKLVAEDGKEYLDANSSWWTVLHGHSHPHIYAAVKAQIDQLDHVVFAGTTHPKAVEAAERITHLLGDGFDRVFFSDNGSTANEVALKMVVQYWFNQGKPEKRKFVALEGAYHGDTFGAMSVGERDLFNKPFESLFFDVTYLPFPTADNEQKVLEMAEQIFQIQLLRVSFLSHFVKGILVCACIVLKF
jgi:adenosylmethionine-8-amino-7-oxononanoate aminotransferase